MGSKKEAWKFGASVALLWLLLLSASSFCQGQEMDSFEVGADSRETGQMQADGGFFDFWLAKPPEDNATTTTEDTSAEVEGEESAESIISTPATTTATATTTSRPVSTPASSTAAFNKDAITSTTPRPETTSTLSSTSTDEVSATSKAPTTTRSATTPTTPPPTPVPNSSSRPTTSLAEDYAQDLERQMNTWFAAVDFFQNNLTYSFFNKVGSVVDMIKHQTHYLMSRQGDCRSEALWECPFVTGPSILRNRADCLETLKKRDDLVQEFLKLVDDFKTTNFAMAEQLRASSKTFQQGYAEQMVTIEKYVVPIDSVPYRSCVMEAAVEPKTTPSKTTTTRRWPWLKAKKSSSDGFARDAALTDAVSFNVKRNVDLLKTAIESQEKEKDYSQVVRALRMIQPHPTERHPPMLKQTILPALPEIAQHIFNHKLVQLRVQIGPEVHVLTANDDGSIASLKVTEAGLSDTELEKASWEFQPNTYEKTALYLRHKSRSYESVCALRNETGSLTGQLRLGKATSKSNCYWNMNIVCDPADSSEANEVEENWGELDKINCYLDMRNFKASNYSLGVNAKGEVGLKLFWADDHFDEISVVPSSQRQ